MLRAARATALASYLAVGLLIVVWQLAAAKLNAALLAALLLPLALPLPGLLRGRERAHVWGSLVILLYLLHGMVTVTGPTAQPLFGYLEIALSLSFLVSASLWLRWRQRIAAGST